MLRRKERSNNMTTHYSKATIKQRGWTDKAIELFLISPDKISPNPYYKSAHPMKLYLIKRVEKIEKSKQFKEFQNDNAKRINASKKAVDTKRERILVEVNKWVITLSKMDYQEVVMNAIESYNHFKQHIAIEREHYDFELATKNSGDEFIERITVNYLRHILSNYDVKLEQIFGKVGKSEAYTLLNDKIYSKISDTYPQLERECMRQLKRKNMKI